MGEEEEEEAIRPFPRKWRCATIGVDWVHSLSLRRFFRAGSDVAVIVVIYVVITIGRIGKAKQHVGVGVDLDTEGNEGKFGSIERGRICPAIAISIRHILRREK